MAKPITPQEMTSYVEATWDKCKKEAWQEHEPVAVWELEEDGWNTIADPNWMETLPVGTRLYTAPPKREWVGYTNEDRERIVPVLVQSLLNHDEKTMAGLLKAILIDIEAQLKEKNHGNL